MLWILRPMAQEVLGLMWLISCTEWLPSLPEQDHFIVDYPLPHIEMTMEGMGTLSHTSWGRRR